MLSLFKHRTNIGFIKNRYKAYAFSLLLFVITFISLALHGGLKMGVDFTGGTLLQVHFNDPISTDDLRLALSQAGLAGAEIQKIKDTELIKNAFLIRTGLKEKEGAGQQTIAQKVTEVLGQKYPQNPLTVDSDETVGPKIGKELKWSAFWAVMAGLLAILTYVAIRFDFRFGVAAVASLFHDVICTIGFISITGMEFSLQSVAVLLTIVGYSINDSIVVADRIRENVKKPNKETYGELINRSLNETLSRTVITVLTVLLVLLSLQFFAGRILQDFTKPLIFGLLIGTYSSIFIVAAIVADWEKKSPTKRKK
jgi:preprotein translocase SecF subunit